MFEDVLNFSVGIILGLFIAGIGVFLLKTWMDPYSRVKILRNNLKKNYIIVSVVSKDQKSQRDFCKNADNDIIFSGTKMWILERGSIYRKDKPEEGFNFATRQTIKGDKDKGIPDREIYLPNQNILLFREGVPIIYVDEDNTKPLTLGGTDQKTTVKPAQAGAVLNSWVDNQIAKGLLAMKNKDWIVWLQLGFLLILLFLVYDMRTQVADMHDRIQNGTLSISSSQNPTLPEGSYVDNNGHIVIGGSGG